MGCLVNLRKRAVAFTACALLLPFAFCAKDPVSSPASGGDDTPTPIPTVTITSPSTDTATVYGVDSVETTVKGTFTDHADVDQLLADLDDITDSVVDDSFSYTFILTQDTTTLVISVLNIDDSVETDAVTFIMLDTTTIDTTDTTTTDTTIAQGMAKISGVLLQESDAGAPKALSKITTATNAAGTQSVAAFVAPVTGADIMLYDADAVTTSADTSVTTDSTGHWEVELPPGNYFVFAFYLDRENFEIVTAALPDIVAEESKETVTDSTTAASDDVNPMLMTFLDAIEPNSDNRFIASDIPENLPIIMTFSEPMTRLTAGDSVTGVVLGSVDPTSTDLALLDTIPVLKKWGPSGKELRLYPGQALEVDSTYRVIIPSTSKDLALNKLDNAYSGIFSVSAAADLPPFELKRTLPADGDTIGLGYPVELVFSRPVDALTLKGNCALVSDSGDTVRGFFEAKGGSAKFNNNADYVQGMGYSMTVGVGVKDLIGDSLGAETAFSFVIQPKDTFEQTGGLEGEIAAAINRFLGAYVAGDIETFALGFHSNFEQIDADTNGQELRRMQRDQFLEERRADIANNEQKAKYGIIAPTWYTIAVGSDSSYFWKITNGTTSAYLEDLGPNAGMGKMPLVLLVDDSSDITDNVEFLDGKMIVNDDTLIFAPPMDKAFIDDQTREDDPSFFGKLLRDETDVETREILMEITQRFEIRAVEVNTAGDTGKASVEFTMEVRFQNNVRPDPNAPEVMHEIMAFKMRVVKEGSKWLIIQLVSTQIAGFQGTEANYQPPEPVDNAVFTNPWDFAQTQAIEFDSPLQKAVAVDTPVVLSWSAPAGQGINGFLVGVSDEIAGGNSGLLLFTRNDSLVINPDGSVSGAQVLSRDPGSLPLPMPMFQQRLSSMSPGDSAVYLWKVAGVSDSTAATISDTSTFVIADSDFGSHGGGPGIFTLLDEMPDITLPDFGPPPPPGNDMFADRDGDTYPDWIEKAFGTSPDDPGQFPNFAADADRDGYPDFMEELAIVGTDPADETSTPNDVENNNIADELEALPDWRPELAMDDDGDGFPNEIEFLAGTDPWNPNSKPKTQLKPPVPVGVWYGFVEFEGQPQKSIAMTISTDTSTDVDWVTVDSTEVEGLERGGFGVNAELNYQFGEWVFFLPITEGPKIGQYLKVRFFAQGNVVEGPIDIADCDGCGGPWVGSFRAADDPNFDWNNFMPPPGGDPNMVNLGPAPMDRMVRPDSVGDIFLTMTFDSMGGPPVATLEIHWPTDTSILVDDNVYWAPGMWPALGFHFNYDGWDIRMDGDLHLNGDPQGDDTLVLIGPLVMDSAMTHYEYDCVLLLGGDFGDPGAPNGTFAGWWMERDAPGPIMNPQGPQPYIGPEANLLDALTQTSNNAVLESDTTNTLVTIDSVSRMGDFGPWSVWVDTTEYFVLEGDPNEPNFWETLTIVNIGGQDALILRSFDDMPPMMGPMFYMGDQATLDDALSLTSNRGMVDGAMDTLTLSNPRQDPAKGEWTVDGSDGQEYTVLADPNDMTWVMIKNDGVQDYVGVMGMMGPGGAGTPPISGPYPGPASDVISMINGGSGVAEYRDPVNPGDPPEIFMLGSVMAADVRDDTDPGSGDPIVVITHNSVDYVVLADDMNNVAVEGGNNILVRDMAGGPGGATVPPISGPYAGSATDVTALITGGTGVAELREGVNPGDPAEIFMLPGVMAADVRDDTEPGTGNPIVVITHNSVDYVVLADDMNNVATDGAGNILVRDMAGSPGGPGVPPISGPYGGASADVIALITGGAGVAEIRDPVNPGDPPEIIILSGVLSTDVSDGTDPGSGDPIVVITHNAVGYVVLADDMSNIALDGANNILVRDTSAQPPAP